MTLKGPAKSNDIAPIDFVNKVSENFKDLSNLLEIINTDFSATAQKDNIFQTRVACETLATTNLVVLAGEVRISDSSSKIDKNILEKVLYIHDIQPNKLLLLHPYLQSSQQ